MIPVKLTLSNFMSYGEEPTVLQLEDLHVACLSGDNGNGKSALLDAMMWALWGKTRASVSGAVSDDELIRQGAEEMLVEFEFEMNVQRYRVVRRRRRNKAPSWDILQSDGNGGFKAMGAGGVRNTGRLIVQLLNMEFETFLNSAYLQQGKADEFTRQTPNNRKRVVADILGLGKFDQLEAAAKERYRERKETAEELHRRIKVLDADIGRLPEYELKLQETQARADGLDKDIAEQETATALLRDRRAQLELVEGQAVDARAGCVRLDNEIARQEQELKRQREKVASLEGTIAQRDSIVQDHARLLEAQRRRDELEPQVEAFNAASMELAAVTGAIALEESALKGELALADQNAKATEARDAECKRNEQQLAEWNAKLVDEDVVRAELERSRQQLSEAQQTLAELKARHKSMGTEIDELTEVIGLLRSPRAACPVCQSDLSGSRQADVLKRQEAKLADLEQRRSKVTESGRAAKTAQSEAEAACTALTARSNELTAARAKAHHLKELVQRLREQGIDAGAARGQADLLRQRIVSGDFAGGKREKKRRIEAEMDRLKKVKSEAESVRALIQSLQPVFGMFTRLQQAEETLPVERQGIQRIEEARTRLMKEHDAQAARLNEFRARLAGFDALKKDTGAAEAKLNLLQNTLVGVRMSEGQFNVFIGQGVAAREQRLVLVSDHRKADEERRIYQDLAAAFGKKGVQALIIENAIPELETEANELLARITDNAMQVSFDMTRDSASGSEIETLEIKITDDLGTRPYELFSGGEAFRVNFAIRIALSRLLARRAGAKLQTLILDEGFGTQDGKGREKLIEVIETIKDDFEKILVITHVEELKEAFPHRIEVTKDATGSHIHVI